ncbi:DUF423 domain-containing protein [Marinomonas posidonica]|uniref:DUF423 domain-containing protein n=1 Tax=Marinomonas posidonica (strain CECT 7376 / NCIMB 14433 / IVIA-Po-181) TaxID=491952 RepID=F6CZ41_MARPP|nr:DUF423 domain-containing protein [Marinomonas posidonica]AEF53497.1 protein of unknown function DUF423 [Marinomonas posidonica IVIA-Po-181]
MPKASFPARWASLFALQAFIAVVAGAFGAHALTSMLEPKALAWWQTASQYLMYHALAGLLFSLFYTHIGSVRRILALLLVGNLLFSGSLYLMALTQLTWLGMLTPLGGMCYLMAWTWFVWRLWQCKP